jgi:predicted dehydrogenase
MAISPQTEHRTCKIAFVGAGGTIREHALAFKDVPRARLVGITNRTRANGEALAGEVGIPTFYGTIDELWERTKADLVVMAVYETAINHTAKLCLQYPWAVFMEKPVGLDLADARDIQAVVARSGRRVWVGLNRRALSSTRAALNDLADDEGQRFIHVQDQQSLETARAIGHQDAVIRNWMYANSIHLVDYLLTFGRGRVENVERIVRWDSTKPGVVVAKVAFSSGDIGLYEALWNGPGPWACTVTTPRRRWELRPLEQATYQNAGERKLNPVEREPLDAQFKPGFRFQAEQVVAAWRGEPSGAPPFTEAIRAMQLVHDIYAP